MIKAILQKPYKISKMKINVLVFGQIAAIISQKEFAFQDVKDTNELVAQLNKKYPQLQSFEYALAVNKKMIHKNTSLKNSDTVALLPPYSGG